MNAQIFPYGVERGTAAIHSFVHPLVGGRVREGNARIGNGCCLACTPPDERIPVSTFWRGGCAVRGLVFRVVGDGVGGDGVSVIVYPVRATVRIICNGVCTQCGLWCACLYRNVEIVLVCTCGVRVECSCVVCESVIPYLVDGYLLVSCLLVIELVCACVTCGGGVVSAYALVGILMPIRSDRAIVIIVSGRGIVFTCWDLRIMNSHIHWEGGLILSA